MRFSIRLGGWCSYRAEVASTVVLIRESPAREWRWNWIDGTPMSLKSPAVMPLRQSIVVDGETISVAKFDVRFIDWKSKGWIWSYGDSRLVYRAAYRRRRTWREVFPPLRHLLAHESGTYVATWQGEPGKTFDGIIRRSVPDNLARVAFGIILSNYVPDPFPGPG